MKPVTLVGSYLTGSTVRLGRLAGRERPSEEAGTPRLPGGMVRIKP